MIAISHDGVPDSARLAKDLALPFALLSDPDRRVAKTFGIALPDDLLPSAFVVDRRARVQWAHVGKDPADQPSPRQIRKVLEGGGRPPVPAPSDVLTPVVAVFLGVVFALLGVVAAVANLRLLPLDRSVRDTIRDVDVAWFDTVMRGVTWLGSRWVILALTVPMAALAWRRCRQLAVVLVGALPAALALELLLKVVVDRPRPPLGSGFGSSFPSGHVLAAAAFWGLVPPWAYLATRRRWVWGLSALAAGVALAGVGVSRVYLGAHWPSDALGGYLGGAVFLLAAEWAVRRPWRALRCEACELHPLRGPGARALSSN